MAILAGNLAISRHKFKKKYLGRGLAHSEIPSPMGRGYPSPYPTFFGACGASRPGPQKFSARTAPAMNYELELAVLDPRLLSPYPDHILCYLSKLQTVIFNVHHPTF